MKNNADAIIFHTDSCFWAKTTIPDVNRRFATKSLRNEVSMINFNNKKNKQIFSASIIIILVLAMVVPMVASALLY